MFQAAAAESQAFPNQLTIAEAQYQYDNFVNKVGCAGLADTLQCLRSAGTAKLQVNQGNIPYPGQSISPLYMWSAVIDGDFIVDYTYRTFAEGRFVKVPTIAGYVDNACASRNQV